MEIAFRSTSPTFTGGMVVLVNGEEKGILRQNGRIRFELQGDEAVTIQIRYAPNDPPARKSPIGRFFTQR